MVAASVGALALIATLGMGVLPANAAPGGSNHIVGWGSAEFGEALIPESLVGKTVTQAAAGGVHSMALTSDGQITAWGRSDPFGQATVPDSLAGKTVTQIAAGDYYSMVLTSEGKVVAWGDNAQGRSTVPAELNGKTVTQISAGPSHAVAVTVERYGGNVVSWGSNYSGESHVPMMFSGTTFDQVVAGGNFNLGMADWIPDSGHINPGTFVTLPAENEPEVTASAWWSATGQLNGGVELKVTTPGYKPSIDGYVKDSYRTAILEVKSQMSGTGTVQLRVKYDAATGITTLTTPRTVSFPGNGSFRLLMLLEPTTEPVVDSSFAVEGTFNDDGRMVPFPQVIGDLGIPPVPGVADPVVAVGAGAGALLLLGGGWVLLRRRRAVKAAA